ncbi:alpha/beta fold hydrolase [Catellatospora tritici]|uniref:alpha/beta fold hydrolase n=1 Tax=Catellatospora tritici TaxID=2851566 RepID=UPI001C2CF33C|nr:alpha/beta hydrolase [Catellatospora tritici]MBV1855060.1 alpha/beta hydrolase [Catellatospora tritici]
MTTTGTASLRRREDDNWEIIENTPDQTASRVLMLPGLFCTAEFYTDVLSDPALAEAGVLARAADPPGFAGRPVPKGFDYRVETYADLVEQYAERESIDLIVGHSYFANVGVEIAARGRYRGKLLLLSPSFSRADEEADLLSLDGASRIPVVGTLVWLGINPSLKKGMRDRLPSARFNELFAQMKLNSHAANRHLVTGFFDHIKRYGDLTGRLAAATTPVWVARGDRDEVGFTEQEQAGIARAPHVELKTIPGAAHFSITDTPHAVVQLVLDLLALDPAQA